MSDARSESAQIATNSSDQNFTDVSHLDKHYRFAKAEYEEELKETIRQGRQRQIPIQPQKYEYSKAYGHLVDNNTHIVALVLFRIRENEQGRPMANNYIVTAFQKEIK